MGALLDRDDRAAESLAPGEIARWCLFLALVVGLALVGWVGPD